MRNHGMEDKHNRLEAEVAHVESDMSEKQYGVPRANAAPVAHVFQGTSFKMMKHLLISLKYLRG